MPTALPPPHDPGAFYVVDLMGYVFRAYHALPPMSTARGEPTHAVYGVTQMLLALIKEQRPVLLAVTLDPPGPSFRKEMYPEYKANREEHPADLREQIDRLEEVLEAYSIPSLAVPGFEADDVIATLVRQAGELGLRSVIVSADKDILQCVGTDVVMFDTMRDRVYGVEETVAKLGVPPHQVTDFLAMTGDPSDNVPGVPSVGPKTASKLLGAHPDLDAIYAALDRIKGKSLKAKLAEHKDSAYLSRELVTLRDDAPVSLDMDALRYGGADHDKLRALFTRLEFHKLLPQLESTPREPIEVKVITDEKALEARLSELRGAGGFALHTLAEGEDAHRANLVGVGLSLGPNDAAYIPLGHLYAGAPRQLAESVLVQQLGPLLTDPKSRLALGDSKRERLLWRRLGVELCGVGFDAMLASYLVDPERHGHTLEEISRSEHSGAPLDGYDALTDKRRGFQLALCDVPVPRAAEYAGERAALVAHVDAALAPRIEAQGLQALLDDIELPLARVLADLEGEGVAVHAPTLSRLSAEYGKRTRALELRAYEIAGREFKINSPRELEKILFDELSLPVVRRTKTGRSTDAAVLEELGQQHDLPGVIIEYRMLTKLIGTYLDALPRVINPDTGRIHTRFNQAVAATGRMSSSDPNLQNIPIRTEEGRAIRDAFIARPGFSIMSADYSQIELRVLAHLSDDAELVDAFSKNEDVHIRTASALFEVPREDVTREMRGRAKTVNYAVIYGQTQFALARNLSIEKEEAQRYIDAFFARYAGVTRYMLETVEEASVSGRVRTLLGRWRTLPDIRSRNRGLRNAAERVARNTPIQGTAADLMKVAMVNVHRALKEGGHDSKMLLTVHDELVFEVAHGEEDDVRALVKDGMENVAQLKVPLLVDIGIGPTWNAAH